MNSAVEPIIREQWIVKGKPAFGQTEADASALYIKPLLLSVDVPLGTSVRHSLLLDNNILNDLLKDRFPADNRFLEDLIRQHPIELNPMFALIEQRQSFGGASNALFDYAEYLDKTFSNSKAKQGREAFENSLEEEKEALRENSYTLSGYLAAIVFLYHQNVSAEKKLEWLAGIVINADMPFFQLHFYFAALVFLAKESPSLFNPKHIKKIVADMEIESTIKGQKEKILNLSNDLALPSLAFISAGMIPSDTLIFPYIATRDRLVQLFLSQIVCLGVYVGYKGRSHGSWGLDEGGVLARYLGAAVDKHMPRRSEKSSNVDILLRKGRLQIFADHYIKLAVDLNGSAAPSVVHDRVQV